MKTAYILGGAFSVFKDFSRAPAPCKEDGLIAVNDIGMRWPDELVAWVSLHGDQLIGWMKRREQARLTMPENIFTSLSAGDLISVRAQIKNCVEPKFPGQVDGGSSGLFAVKVALMELSFDRVILCGVPMTREGAHFYDDKPWDNAERARIGWQQAEPHLKGRVFSMSGWTKEFLGEP